MKTDRTDSRQLNLVSRLCLVLLMNIFAMTLCAPILAGDSAFRSEQNAATLQSVENQLNPGDAPPKAVRQCQFAASTLDQLPYKYWGNSYSLKFHRPSCPFAKAMNVSHVEFFHFRCEAIARGEQPCRYCLPPSWRAVKCVLLPARVLGSEKQEQADEESLHKTRTSNKD